MRAAALKWCGPALAALGLIAVAALAFLPALRESPLTRWILTETLAPARVLPLIGLGAAFRAYWPARPCRSTGAVRHWHRRRSICGGLAALDARYAATRSKQFIPHWPDLLLGGRRRTHFERALTPLRDAGCCRDFRRDAGAHDQTDRSQPARPCFHVDAGADRFLDRCCGIVTGAHLLEWLVPNFRPRFRQLADRNWLPLWWGVIDTKARASSADRANP